jgi:lipoprotein-releasing system permease protein
MRLALRIAKQYLSTRKKSFVQKISNICIITVTVSIAIPVLVLSVFGGFHKNVGNKILTLEGDIKVIPPYVDFTNYEEIIEVIENDKSVSPMIKEVIPYFDAYGIIKRYKQKYPTRLLAVPEKFYEGSNIYQKEIINAYTNFNDPESKELPNLEENNVVLGRKLMHDLLTSEGSEVEIYLPFSLNAININLQEKEFIVSGGIISGFNKYEESLTIMRFEDVAKSFGIEKYASGLMIYLENPSQYREVVRRLKKIPQINPSKNSEKREYTFILTQEEGLFLDFEREKGLMRVALIILVLASFMTIYITLNVVVLDKQKEIGIMKAFGVDSHTVSRIFIIEGFLIGIIGGFAGVTLGMFMSVHLSDIIKAFEWVISGISCGFLSEALPFKEMIGFTGDCKIVVIPDDTFYITNMPSDPHLMDVLIQTIGAITASVLAAYFPSVRAAKQKPIETLTRK